MVKNSHAILAVAVVLAGAMAFHSTVMQSPMDARAAQVPSPPPTAKSRVTSAPPKSTPPALNDGMTIGPPIAGNGPCTIEGLVQWVKDEGGQVGDILFGDFLIEEPHEDWITRPKYRRGVMAGRDFVDGEEVVQIPLQLSMSRQSAEKTPIQRVFETVPQMESFESLILHVLYESRNPTSFWRPFLCQLPRSIPLPIFWKDAEVQAMTIKINDSRLPVDVEATRNVLHKYYNDIMPFMHAKFPDLFPPEEVTFGHFAWSAAVVMSRAWGMTVTNSTTSMHVLCPVADLFNHKKGYRSVSFSLPEWWMKVTTTGNIRKGQEIFLSYGEKCNRRMVVNYGFMLAENAQIPCA